MTAVIPTPSSPAAGPPASIRTLSIIEAKRYLRRAPLWIGLAGTVAIAIWPSTGSDSWSGRTYEDTIPLSFGPLAIGVFIAAVRTGGRDRVAGASLAEAAPIGSDERTAARLAGLIVPVAAGILVVLGMAIASRVEGGYWIGHAPRRTDSALHSVLEWIQPPLIIAVAGSSGVAIGRAVRIAVPAIVAGAAAWFLAFVFYWAWNTPGLHAVAPVQVQPLRIELPIGTDPNLLPATWLVEGPGPYNGRERLWVHLPTVFWHNIYLFGLVLLWSGLAMRGRHVRRLTATGLGLAGVGVAAQLLVSPF